MKKNTSIMVSRRSFMKKTAYIAPVVITLGTLSAPLHAKTSAINIHANNGFGNGDQTAPGNSGHHNGAENQVGNKGNKLKVK